MRALSERAGVIVAGFIAFFGGILMLAIALVLWFLGLTRRVGQGPLNQPVTLAVQSPCRRIAHISGV